MVTENASCIELLQQISAARRALDKLALALIQDHLESCVRDQILKENSSETVQELMTTLDRFLS